MRWSIFLAGIVALTVTFDAVQAQEVAVREQLVARGAPAEFADRVAEIVADADADGLPTDPLAAKALEGWAKRGRVPQDRVLTVLEQLSANLQAGRDAASEAGLDPAPAMVVAAAGEALGRGMTREDVQAVIASADAPEAAATGLTVASSMAAQGLDRAAAVRAVREAFGQGHGPTELLELPSVIAELIARGVPMSDVARQILEGGGLPLTPGRGLGLGRAGSVPAGRGPPIEPPGQGKSKKGGKGKPPGT